MDFEFNLEDFDFDLADVVPVVEPEAVSTAAGAGAGPVINIDVDVNPGANDSTTALSAGPVININVDDNPGANDSTPALAAGLAIDIDVDENPAAIVEDGCTVAGPSRPAIQVLANDIIRPALLANQSILRNCLETGARNYDELRNAEQNQKKEDDEEFSSISTQIEAILNRLESSTSEQPAPPTAIEEAEETQPPLKQFSQNSSTDSESPVLSHKRKRISRQGGRAIKRVFEESPSHSSNRLSESIEETSPASSQSAFSQPHQKEVLLLVKNIIDEVREKVEEHEIRVRDTGRRRRLAEETLRDEQNQLKEDRKKKEQLFRDLQRIKNQIKELEKDSARRQVRINDLQEEVQAAVEANRTEKANLKKFNNKLAELHNIFTINR